METTITMTAREQRRARVLTRTLAGDLTIAAGAETLGLSVRQVWRLRARQEEQALDEFHPFFPG